MRLTDLTIRAFQPPEKGAVIHYDDAITGFGVRVSEGGTKSYVLTYGTRRQRQTIGRVNVISLKDARKEAKTILASYTLGKPAPGVVSWSSALSWYLEEIGRTRRSRTLKDYTRVLHRHFRLGNTRLSEISSADLQHSLDKLSSTPSEHHHAFQYLRSFINWAYQKHYIDKNPMERMKPPRLNKPRERILSDKELREIWRAAGEIGQPGTIVKLLILTGQRVGEVSKLQTDMVGENQITIPQWLTKNGREHSFPIGKLATRLLASAKTRGNLLFPGHLSKPVAFNSWSRPKATLDKLSQTRDWTLHDLRRTFASGLAAHGVSLHVIERLLNHISGSFAGIVSVYQRYDYAKEMREAVELWEKHIVKLTA